MLDVAVQHAQGEFTLDARFASDGALTALFGRSGAGKTTLLNLIAGLARPRAGRIVVDGQTLVDTAQRIFVPPHKRRVGYVFQDARLFPHLDVRGNLLYGRWLHPRATHYASFDDVVALLGLASLLARRPAALSGGEKQRVAIGRALLASPRLLLMDEPLASVDHARRDEVLTYIERLRDGLRIPIVYVSHELVEVARLATTVVAMVDGRVTACGSVTDVLAQAGALLESGDDPVTVIDAVVAAHEDDYALTAVHACGGELHVPRVDLPPGAPLRICIRARDVMVATQAPRGISAQNVLAGEIVALRAVDTRSVDVTIACGGTRVIARITQRAAHALALTAGMPVHALVKSVAIDRSARGLPVATAS